MNYKGDINKYAVSGVSSLNKDYFFFFARNLHQKKALDRKGVICS